MSPHRRSSIVALLRVDPATGSILLFGPPVLAVGQLLNSYYHDVPIGVAIAFAIVMVVGGAVATDCHAAECRRRELESQV